ncbi:MAG: class I SAM-dependent methyltransferase [Actinoallomurus sp.]
MTVASKLEPVLSRLFDGAPPVRIRAWDGSETGPSEGPVLVLRSRRALRRVLWSPGELGLARAYVSGDLDVEGDLTDGLRALWAALPSPPRVPWVRAALLAVRLGAPPRPETSRDHAAVAHRDNVPVAFYELLDESMACSCAYFDDDDLARAQRAKLGVEVTGITLSEEQAAYARDRAKGLPVEIRVQDHRETDDGPYDAVASIEMAGHDGAAGYPVFAAKLFSLVRPGGSVVIQQLSRPAGAPPGGATFVETSVAPGTHLRPIAETVELLHAAGLEVQRLQDLREDYVRTAEAWSRNLEARWDDAVKLLGEEDTRLWSLSLASRALAFEREQMGVDQIHAVRPED